MLIVRVDKKNIDVAIKNLKGKLIKTKQNIIIFDKKEFIKKNKYKTLFKLNRKVFFFHKLFHSFRLSLKNFIRMIKVKNN